MSLSSATAPFRRQRHLGHDSGSARSHLQKIQNLGWTVAGSLEF